MSDSSLKEESRLRLASLMTITVVVNGSNQSLRKELFGTELNLRKKVDTLWKKAGYIESCLELFTRCESIEFKAKAIEEGNSSPEV